MAKDGKKIKSRSKILGKKQRIKEDISCFCRQIKTEGRSRYQINNMAKANKIACNSKWVLYILVCRGERLYTGITNDLQARLKAHKEGKGSKFVRAFSPFVLAGAVPCKDGTEARKLECKVKKMRRSGKLDFLKLSKKSPYCSE